MYIVELSTPAGKVSEVYASYEEARQRVDQFAPDGVVGIPFIFAELADGSQRLVREDGKPLQWHRVAQREADAAAGAEDEPLPLADESSGLLGEGRWVPIERPPEDDWGEPL